MDKEILLITGSCGRIGNALVERLKEKYTCIGLERPSAIPTECDHPVFPVDLSSNDSVQKAFDHIRKAYGSSIRSVIHLDAFYSFSLKPSNLYRKGTVQGTQNLLRTLKNFQVGQFIFTNTVLIHAPTNPGNPIGEDSPVSAKWGYLQSNVETEKVLKENKGEIPFVTLRIGDVYDDECHSIPMSQQIQQIYEKKLESHFFPGNLNHGSAFIHINDVVDAISLCIEKSPPSESTFLIGEEKTLSYLEMQKTISYLLQGREINTYRIPKWIAKTGAFFSNLFGKPLTQPWMIDVCDNHYELDISNTKEKLSWSPKEQIKKTLPLMIQSLKSDPNRWYKENGL